MNATVLRRPGVKMTLHVYTVDRHGKVLADHGITVVRDRQTPPIPFTDAYPPCQCPRHRAGQAATR
ncbi:MULTISPECIES: hypothetical protein [unclassified Streptomyces]|uniref:hypothetical protein n=1 Tax=Streptomyces sp. GDS52 TaxID=3406419 RepID=UPI003FD41045